METLKHKVEILAGEVKLNFVKKGEAGETLNSSKKSADYLRELFTDQINLRESFYIVGLNQANKVHSWFCLGQGGLTFCPVDVRLAMQYLLLSGCTACIISHNHPSGSLKPSQSDFRVTNEIKAACEFFSIRVLDHVIVTEEGSYSFADHGCL